LSSKKPELTAKQQQLLREQAITELTPGTLLHDFEAFLTFVAEHPLEATGKKHLLPLSSLDPLNARMARPLTLTLKRAVQKSYPHINGLFLLARAAGLLRVAREDGVARFRLDEAAVDSWRGLNLTERYFTLFEAYLLHALQEMIGERGGWIGTPGMLNECLRMWARIGDKGIKIPQGKSIDKVVFGGWFYHFGLLELFGLIQVKPGKPQPGKGWSVAEIKQTPFGEALMTALMLSWGEQLERMFGDDLDGESEEDEDDSPRSRVFDAYQKQFQPYFPELQRTFSLQEQRAHQTGVFQFKVSLGKTWRRIAISSEATLDDLSYAILGSVNFDNDHLHCFEYKNSLGVTRQINHDAMDEPPFSSEVSVGDLPLAPGDQMKYTFDFGDNWQFQILLEEIGPPDKKMKRPRVIESHGKAPKQYRDWNEDDW
jgi:hypothetical protein